jgi:hypothetical protein
MYRSPLNFVKVTTRLGVAGMQTFHFGMRIESLYPDFALYAQNHHQMDLRNYKENRGWALYVQN